MKYKRHSKHYINNYTGNKLMRKSFETKTVKRKKQQILSTVLINHKDVCFDLDLAFKTSRFLVSISNRSVRWLCDDGMEGEMVYRTGAPPPTPRH